MTSVIIKQFNKAKYVEKIIDSCETQEQIEACDKWIYQIDIDEDYKSHFHLLLASKSKQLLKNEKDIHNEENRCYYSH